MNSRELLWIINTLDEKISLFSQVNPVSRSVYQTSIRSWWHSQIAWWLLPSRNMIWFLCESRIKSQDAHQDHNDSMIAAGFILLIRVISLREWMNEWMPQCFIFFSCINNDNKLGKISGLRNGTPFSQSLSIDTASCVFYSSLVLWSNQEKKRTAENCKPNEWSCCKLCMLG